MQRGAAWCLRWGQSVLRYHYPSQVQPAAILQELQPSSELCSSSRGTGWFTENTQLLLSMRITWGWPRLDPSDFILVWYHYKYYLGEGNGTPLHYSCLVLSNGFRGRSSCLLWVCGQKFFSNLLPTTWFLTSPESLVSLLLLLLSRFSRVRLCGTL